MDAKKKVLKKSLPEKGSRTTALHQTYSTEQTEAPLLPASAKAEWGADFPLCQIPTRVVSEEAEWGAGTFILLPCDNEARPQGVSRSHMGHSKEVLLPLPARVV